jgi:hypothetical protein
MERKTIITQHELKTFTFSDVNSAYDFSREQIEAATTGINESLYVDISPDIDAEGNECWNVAFYITRYYSPNVLIGLLENSS